MKKDGLRNLTKFTVKYLCQSLRPATLLNEKLWHGCFSVNFAIFLRTPFLQKTSGQLLLNLSLRCWFSQAAAHRMMFFKISVLKNFAVIMEPLSNNKVTDLLLQNTYGACFWIFVAANTFFLLNMVFIADSRTGFCSGLLWKHELNLRSSHWSCS